MQVLGISLLGTWNLRVNILHDPKCLMHLASGTVGFRGLGFWGLGV